MQQLDQHVAVIRTENMVVSTPIARVTPKPLHRAGAEPDHDARR